jgi:hypothetical protein
MRYTYDDITRFFLHFNKHASNGGIGMFNNADVNEMRRLTGGRRLESIADMERVVVEYLENASKNASRYWTKRLNIEANEVLTFWQRLDDPE